MSVIQSLTAKKIKPLVPDIDEVEIALSVISFAIFEVKKGLKSNSRQSRRYIYGQSAKAWLMTEKSGFDHWCNLIRLNPEYVRTLVKKEIEYYEKKRKRKSTQPTV